MFLHEEMVCLFFFSSPAVGFTCHLYFCSFCGDSFLMGTLRKPEFEILVWEFLCNIHLFADYMLQEHSEFWGKIILRQSDFQITKN